MSQVLLSGIEMAAGEVATMKRTDRTAEMIGQLIEPVPEAAEEFSSKAPLASSGGAQSYQLVSLLGQQPGRRTFLAVDSCTQANVVIKLLLFGPDFTWEDLKLFEREAETLKSLDYPTIPKYLDSFESETLLGSGFVLVQTYIKAKSLQDWVVGGRRFDEKDLIAIAKDLLNILEYLHSRYPTVIHRDIKPSNILLTNRSGHSPGTVYLIDFGSVHITNHSGTMTVVGTYGYMPPEQFGGRAFPGSDLYSLGAMLLFIATGQHPAELMPNGLQLEFDKETTLSAPIAQWIGQLTNHSLSQRIQSAQQALEALDQSLCSTRSQKYSQTQKSAESSQGIQIQKTTSGKWLTHSYGEAFGLEGIKVIEDLKVASVPLEFHIQCAIARISKPLITDSFSFAFILFVVLPGALAIHWSLFLLLLVSWILSFRNQSKADFSETATLQLRVNPNGTLSLCLVTDKKCKMRSVSWSPLQKIEAAVPFLRGNKNHRLLFTFNKDPASRISQLRIDGSPSEMDWLRKQISEWNKVSIED